MDKVNRTRRIQFIRQYISEDLNPEVGMYFGEHVLRVNGQLCLVINSSGELGIRALQSALASELREISQNRHWSAHGREYEQWFLLPETVSLNDEKVKQWIATAVDEVYRLSLISAIPNRRLKA